MKSCRTECGLPDAQPAPATAMAKDPSHTSSVFIITEMDCPTEEQLIRSKLATFTEISAVEFNLMRRQLTVTHAEQAYHKIVKGLQSIGFNPELQGDQPATVQAVKQPLWPLMVAGIAATAAEVAEWTLAGSHWAVVVLTLVVLATVGLPVLKKAG